MLCTCLVLHIGIQCSALASMSVHQALSLVKHELLSYSAHVDCMIIVCLFSILHNYILEHCTRQALHHGSVKTWKFAKPSGPDLKPLVIICKTGTFFRRCQVHFETIWLIVKSALNSSGFNWSLTHTLCTSLCPFLKAKFRPWY